jgi:hypothetical protein
MGVARAVDDRRASPDATGAATRGARPPPHAGDPTGIRIAHRSDGRAVARPPDAVRAHPSIDRSETSRAVAGVVADRLGPVAVTAAP